MKKILGIDVGVSSIGLAVVNRDDNGKASIEHFSVRVVPEDPNFHGNFYSGNTASKNAERTEKRGSRRNNQRFKNRRDKLYVILKENNMFPSESCFNMTAMELYDLRAKAAVEKISLRELGRVFILLNKRRGFLSNRKAETEEEKETKFKEKLAELEGVRANRTIGQQLYKELSEADNYFDIRLRDRVYKRYSYEEEFDRIWSTQKQFHGILTGGPAENRNKGTLYNLIRRQIIYFQRPLKSQKKLVSECRFEKHHKTVPKSSPFFELFRVWQQINNLKITKPGGKETFLNKDQKQQLYEALFLGEKLNKEYQLSATVIKEMLGLKCSEGILNFTKMEGSRTYSMIKKALLDAGIEESEKYLYFNIDQADEKGGLLELWHITYALPVKKDIVNTLIKRFRFTREQASIIEKKVKHSGGYDRLSTRAIKRLLPHMQKGKGYSEACDAVGYDHSGYKTTIELQERLQPIEKKSFRNPVVEQILNQVVNMVNAAIDRFGRFDHIIVELARELRNNAEMRERISKMNDKNKEKNDKTRNDLKDNYGYGIVSGRDIKRFKLWEETNKQCLYCNHPISISEITGGSAEMEHIIPRSRSFSNAMNNLVLAHRRCNSEKNQDTAYDFMTQKGEEALNQYKKRVDKLFKDKRITKAKYKNLLCEGNNIPDDIVNRMIKDTQYIAKETVKLLKTICPRVHTTTGQITDFLREKWGLKHILQELCIEKYRLIGQTETVEYKDSADEIVTYETIKDWTKRDDHRHHAVDALICALTGPRIIFELNNRNKKYQYVRDTPDKKKSDSLKKEFADMERRIYECPIENIRREVKKHLENIFISFKKEHSKVLTKTINKPKNGDEQITWVPRGMLHKETIKGCVRTKNKLKLAGSFSIEQLEDIVNPEVEKIIKKHLEKYNHNPKVAFASKTLEDDPIFHKNKEVKEVSICEWIYTKRVPLKKITAAQINKIADDAVKEVVKEAIKRAKEEGLNDVEKNPKKAFKDLAENPILLRNGKKIKSVTVYDRRKAIALGTKKDRFGNILVDEKNRSFPTNFVETQNNHHALVYKTQHGEYNCKVVSFWQAVAIGLANVERTEKPYPIINRNDDPGLGDFQFSMQINDLFVFDLKHAENPTERNEIDFFDPENRKRISDKLFRVKEISLTNSGQPDVVFRHHLETSIKRDHKALRGITWERLISKTSLSRIEKIHINHIGQILRIGE